MQALTRKDARLLDELIALAGCFSIVERALRDTAKNHERPQWDAVLNRIRELKRERADRRIRATAQGPSR